MSENEPTLLREPGDPPVKGDQDATVPSFASAQIAASSAAKPGPAKPAATPAARNAPVVHVVGFWKRAIAAIVDLFVIVPTATLIIFIVSKLTGVTLPSSNVHILDIDLWIDLVLATDPAIVMGIVLLFAVALVYLMTFHIVQGRTLGMRLLKMRVIDVYGDRPSPARCAIRCAGYLAGFATLFLGFLWMGFDSEKRGLQDWIAGTYVIRA
jgi:resuscitation-promoting factor RpfA